MHICLCCLHFSRSRWKVSCLFIKILNIVQLPMVPLGEITVGDVNGNWSVFRLLHVACHMAGQLGWVLSDPPISDFGQIGLGKSGNFGHRNVQYWTVVSGVDNLCTSVRLAVHVHMYSHAQPHFYLINWYKGSNMHHTMKMVYVWLRLGVVAERVLCNAFEWRILSSWRTVSRAKLAMHVYIGVCRDSSRERSPCEWK